ncbi:MAG: histone deacetylase [Omnitrophica bacterium]|nr:histone deacetylase [Candidatus Omnitrophota bacterium]
MKKIKIFYSDKYCIDIGKHVFPTAKYRLIKEKLSRSLSVVNKILFIEPKKAREEDILLVHTKGYVDKLKTGRLSPEEIMTLELPYSTELAEGAVLCCGGTIGALEEALESGVGIHLGGGFHHAFPDHGEGFCVLNDIAVAVKKSMKEKRIRKALIIDCDLHQGNGTARIFENDENVFTFSIHQENNYPFYKPKSNMDIGLKDRTRDREYLAHLEKNIPRITSDFKPDLMLYVAGADPYEDDLIGNLALTMEGLRKRDTFVYENAWNYQIPIGVVLAGGYAVKEKDTVDIQFNTVKTAVEVFAGIGRRGE